MQDHSADQLNVEMAHVEDTAASFPHYGERLYKDLVQDFISCCNLLFRELLEAIGISFGLIWKVAQPVLDSGAEFIGLRAQLFVREFLHLRFERVDGGHTRPQPLHLTVIFGPENLA